ncbi:MAG: hypothetical protein AAF902_13160 [Chloroflexota bacterium]
MKKFDLVIFDVDGTLCLLDETALMPKRKVILDDLAADNVHLAIATNQGGVGYRLYREVNKKSTNDLPTEAEVLQRLDAIKKNIGWPVRVNIAFSYYIKWENMWSPIPASREWEPFWRRISVSLAAICCWTIWKHLVSLRSKLCM